eukprot:5288271-Amphidinium_carterae.1
MSSNATQLKLTRCHGERNAYIAKIVLEQKMKTYPLRRWDTKARYLPLVLMFSAGGLQHRICSKLFLCSEGLGAVQDGLDVL